jgi:hypothetical protein
MERTAKRHNLTKKLEIQTFIATTLTLSNLKSSGLSYSPGLVATYVSC